MKFLHTSDWHLGRSLYGRKRYDEFAAFLDWLGGTMETEKTDTLLVAGDIFDTSTPGNRAQELYYRFLCRVAGSCCRHVVVAAGNHDSPSFLNAPKELLRVLNVHVVGMKTENPEDQVIVLSDDQGRPEAVVCAVPYLRDRDIRISVAGETMEDRDARLVEGVKNHYAEICAIAERRRKELGNGSAAEIPIVATGHLFTAGGKTVDGDGVRDLYVGSLAYVGRDAFPESIDYLALGHLHVPQRVGGADHIRYSGSPIPMGFGEAKQKKKVLSVVCSGGTPEVREIPVPCFQVLERVSGCMDEIHARLEVLKTENSGAWLEIEYTGPEIVGDLRDAMEESVRGSDLEILRIRNRRLMDRVIRAAHAEETLDDLDETDVFARASMHTQCRRKKRDELLRAYGEILTSIHEADTNAE